MKSFEKLERLKYLTELIEAKSTGSPISLSKKLGIKRAQLYNLIDFLNDYDAEIKYSKIHQSFIYTSNNKRILINCSMKLIDKDKVKKIYGGNRESYMEDLNLILFYSL